MTTSQTPVPPPAGMPPGHYEGLDQALVVKYRRQIEFYLADVPDATPAELAEAIDEYHQRMAVPVCEWFALCTRPSAGTVLHPILGAVPICAPCAEKMGYAGEVGLWLESE